MITEIRWKKTTWGYKLQFRLQGSETWIDVAAVDEDGSPVDKTPAVTKVISF